MAVCGVSAAQLGSHACCILMLRGGDKLGLALTRPPACHAVRLLSPGGRLYLLVLVCNLRVSPGFKRKELFGGFKYDFSWYCSPHIVLHAILGGTGSTV